ncbi:MAG: T9SS type A sorting domain-containing protein [Flavobacteriales bacterium]|nr:T9SS type A sorting domain-containing protein [Flavobacteriales bacterium]MBP6697838.1 T9SS type A sorting domain-containing protein [Flavobacteriales bacterium]
MKNTFTLLLSGLAWQLFAQTNVVTYAGGSGNEAFNDVVQISDGRILVIGTADDLGWIDGSVPQFTLTATGIANGLGTNKVPFILVLDSTAQTLLAVHHLQPNAAEDLRFIKLTNAPGEPTGDIYLSGTTEDATNGGYFIGKLDDNFVNGDPTGFAWVINVKCAAGEYPKIYQPWDVGGDGKVVYGYGDSHSYNWSAFYRNDADGNPDVVPHWRIHWPLGGGPEHRGDAATFLGGIGALDYSAIVLKRDATRCELRSPTQVEFDLWQPDGNGGTKKGTWPLDILYSEPCLPGGTGNTTDGPGYTGYSGSATFTHGPQSVCIDRRTNNMYIGFNTKSVLPGGQPDFEPAVMAMDADGALLWWSRLYHEVTPGGDTLNSSPDQYVDALAIDYSEPPASGLLVVNARCHGNNVENLWEGDTIAANPGASGFQNRFTGNNGNIHISWLGKLTLADGTLMHSTYVAEYAEGTGSLGAPLADPNLDGWPNPNDGWPDVNTTYLGKNNLKVTADGSVLALGKGRRTITTANAYQKMVKPANGGLSAWNDYVRVYTPDLSNLKYSSLLVGQWDTLTQAGGDNVRLNGSFKTRSGVIVVGRHNATGVDMPVSAVPAWGNAAFNNGSAVFAYLRTAALFDPGDDPVDPSTTVAVPVEERLLRVAPNPTQGEVLVILPDGAVGTLTLRDVTGRSLVVQQAQGTTVLDLNDYAAGTYSLSWRTSQRAERTVRVLVQ